MFLLILAHFGWFVLGIAAASLLALGFGKMSKQEVLKEAIIAAFFAAIIAVLEALATKHPVIRASYFVILGFFFFRLLPSLNKLKG